MVLLPVVELSFTRFDSEDQVMGVFFARRGETDAPMVAPAEPVRIVGEMAGLGKGPAPGSSAGVLPVTTMRKTSLPFASYLARAFAGSQSSAGPLGAARRRFQ